ncbi:ChrR family anti-sigma-E factor [Marimonas lutisalis]|uniref:ChrR family anti-sigma-E factor n=1 Tax=Marimonas lutisalis TaxID=2545756 RepID=UPI0010F9C5BB|nr:ChrR family anti-sigma-E factor [Marimonas lutisalis]
MTTGITHHIPENLIIAYASGALPRPFALVVAAHVSMCDECRARLTAQETAGGAILDTAETSAISDDLRARVLQALDDPIVLPERKTRRGPYPGPVMEALKGQPPRWKSLGLGTRQCIIEHGRAGSVRLLSIPAGQAVPDHGHNGLELTLVLQGAFKDETGYFGPGDLEVADSDLEHTPVADEGETCICLAATDASLRFNTLVPRLLQPLFRI